MAMCSINNNSIDPGVDQSFRTLYRIFGNANSRSYAQSSEAIFIGIWF
jgi:hypothetical protein